MLAAFNGLLDGIRHANVNEVMGANGTTRDSVIQLQTAQSPGLGQVKKNRESSYPEIKNVKLDVRDVSVTMLGRDGAIVPASGHNRRTTKALPKRPRAA